MGKFGRFRARTVDDLKEEFRHMHLLARKHQAGLFVPAKGSRGDLASENERPGAEKDLAPMEDGFDIVAVRVEHEGRIIAGMVVAKAGRAIVCSTRIEGCCVKAVDLLLVAGPKCKMDT
jgi:hypothetical protein